MRIKGLLLCIFAFASLHSQKSGTIVSPHESFKKTDLYNIDTKIESLEDLKDYYLSKAARIRLIGDRLYFANPEENADDAQNKWQLADRYDRMSDQIQEEINSLKKERIEILESADY